MKKVLILFGSKRWDTQAFPKNQRDTYQHCYEYLYSLAEKNGVRLFRASSAWYDQNRKVFKSAWTFKNNSWIRVHNIKPDLIYDKTKLTADSQHLKKALNNSFSIINDIEFTTILDNKFFTSLLFPKFSKKHYLIKNRKDLKNILPKIKSELVVFKTMTGSGGKDIKIVTKKAACKIKIVPNLTAQEFINSSNGIKSLVNSTHDLRLVFINNRLIYAYLRIPQKGSLLANLSQGGLMITLENRDLPKSLNPIIQSVQEIFRVFHPKIYTIDIMFDEKQRPWIVELNSMPGLYFSEDQKKYREKMYLSLIDLFKKFI